MTLITFLSCARKHWSGIAAMVVFILVVAWAFNQGVKTGKADRTTYYEAVLAERDRVSAKALTEALASHQAQAAEAMASERQHLTESAKTEQKFQTITRTVTEYIHANPILDACSLDAVGLRNWNAANRGGAIDPASHP